MAETLTSFEQLGIIPRDNTPDDLRTYLIYFHDLKTLQGMRVAEKDEPLPIEDLRKRTGKMPSPDDEEIYVGNIGKGIEKIDRTAFQQQKNMGKLAKTLTYDAGIRSLAQSVFEGASYPMHEPSEERGIGMQVVRNLFEDLYINIANTFELQATDENTDWGQWIKDQLTTYSANLSLRISEKDIGVFENKILNDIKRAKDVSSLVQTVATRISAELIERYLLQLGENNFNVPNELQEILQSSSDPYTMLEALQNQQSQLFAIHPSPESFQELSSMIEGTIQELELGSTYAYLQDMANIFWKYAPKGAINIYPNGPSRLATQALIDAGYKDISPITWKALEAAPMFEARESLKRKMHCSVYAYDLMEALWKSPNIVAERMGIAEDSEEYQQILALHNQLKFIVSYKSSVAEGVQNMPYSDMPFTFSRPDITLTLTPTPGEDGTVKLVETEAENAPGGLGMAQIQTEAEGLDVTTVDEMYEFMQNMSLPDSITKERQKKMRNKIIVYMCRDTHGGWADYETEAWVFCNAMKQKYHIEAEVVMLEDLVEGKKDMSDLEDAMVFYFTYPDVEDWSEETADINLLFEPDLFARTMGMDLKDLVAPALLDENGEVDREKLEEELEKIKAKQKKEFKKTMSVPVDMLRQEIMTIYKDELRSMQSQHETYQNMNVTQVAQAYRDNRTKTADTMKRMDNDSIYMFNIHLHSSILRLEEQY